MKNFIFLLLFLFTNIQAATTRSIDADSIRSTDHSKTFSFPAATDTLTGRSSTDTLTNKTISGASNTLSNIGYGSLNLTGSILNADISNSASISLSKLSPLTASKATVTDASGYLTTSATSATQIGYLSTLTGNVQTAIDGKVDKSIGTTKGDLIGFSASATPVRRAVGADGQVLTADSAQTDGIKWATPASAPSSSQEISNLTFTTSVAASALTIAVKTQAGTDPSAGDPVKVGMRSSTATSGSYNQRTITGALSLVISSGSTLGQTNAQPSRIWVYLIDNSGTLELAASHKKFSEDALVSTTAEGGAGAADSPTVMYSSTARSNVPCRLIGYIDNTQTTAGTWASAGTTLQLAPFNKRKSPTIQRLTSGSGTYYTPAGCTSIEVEMVGGGGGGAGGGTAAGTSAGDGGDTTFGSSLLTAGKGTKGSYRGTGGGGSATVNSPAVTIMLMSGADGGVWSDPPSTGTMPMGGPAGGASFFGAYGKGGVYNGAGGSGSTNSGSGGGGGGNNNIAGSSIGTGGGAGAYIKARIDDPDASYSYSVGSGGSAGGAGTSGVAGGAGGSGVINIIEFYD